MNYVKYLVFFFVFSCIYTQGKNIKPQKKNLNTRIEVGLNRGIQLSKNFPILKSGEQINISLSKLYGSYFEAGIGACYKHLEDEQFTPVYLLLIGKRKVNHGPYIESAIGYSYGKNNKFKNTVTSIFEGGKYFSTGVGYQFNITNQYTFLASVNYVMQHSKVSHYEREIATYIEKLTFDLIVFKVGLLLK